MRLLALFLSLALVAGTNGVLAQDAAAPPAAAPAQQLLDVGQLDRSSRRSRSIPIHCSRKFSWPRPIRSRSFRPTDGLRPTNR